MFKLHLLDECDSKSDVLLWIDAPNLHLVKDGRVSKHEIAVHKGHLLIGADVVGGEMDVIRKACSTKSHQVLSLETQFNKTGELSKDLEKELGVKIAKVSLKELLHHDCSDFSESSSDSDCSESSSDTECSGSSTDTESSSCTKSSSNRSSSSSSHSPHPPPPPPPPVQEGNWYGWVTFGIVVAVLLAALLYIWYRLAQA